MIFNFIKNGFELCLKFSKFHLCFWDVTLSLVLRTLRLKVHLHSQTRCGLRIFVVLIPNVVINVFCNNGDLKEAKNWYAKLGQSDSTPNKATFAALIRLACKVGDFDWAIELFEQTIEEKCLVDPNVMQLVIHGLVKEKKIEDAKKLVGIGNSNKFRKYNLIVPADE